MANEPKCSNCKHFKSTTKSYGTCKKMANYAHFKFHHRFAYGELLREPNAMIQVRRTSVCNQHPKLKVSWWKKLFTLTICLGVIIVAIFILVNSNYVV